MPDGTGWPTTDGSADPPERQPASWAAIGLRSLAIWAAMRFDRSGWRGNHPEHRHARMSWLGGMMEELWAQPSNPLPR